MLIIRYFSSFLDIYSLVYYMDDPVFSSHSPQKNLGHPGLKPGLKGRNTKKY